MSRVHAILEVDKKDGEVLIYDNKALNHTWKDNKRMKPLVRYHLQGGEHLKFGSVSAVFQIHTNSTVKSNESSTFITKGKKSGRTIEYWGNYLLLINKRGLMLTFYKEFLLSFQKHHQMIRNVKMA